MQAIGAGQRIIVRPDLRSCLVGVRGFKTTHQRSRDRSRSRSRNPSPAPFLFIRQKIIQSDANFFK
ncbi:MAG: hypothetical protein ACTSRP_24520 [Candidatus Helarchaeota archaeon]